MEKKNVDRCSKCGKPPQQDETTWDMGGGIELCNSCHDVWLVEEGPREEAKRESKAVVLTGDRETNESIMMEGTGGTKNEPFSPFLKGAKEVQPLPKRRKLPNERQGFTHKFTILATDRHGEPMPVKGYLTVGLYEDGTVGELFVKMAKQGSEVSGFVDAWAISVSMMLQFGVPINVIVQRFENMRFEPSGRIKDQRDLALSPIDYVCKYLHRKFINDEQV